MLRLSGRRTVHAEEDEGYFISMSDMLTGLLFIFIILLLYFALQFRQTTQELTGANTARQQLLEELKVRLKRQGLQVEIDPVTGVLRLPDAILFESGSPALSPRGVIAVQKVANALIAVLPCYTDVPAEVASCQSKRSTYRIDALFVEGHTDKQRLMRGGRDTNIDLSAQRAINTYLALVDKYPQLDLLTTSYKGANTPDRRVPILSVSGYGPKRPVPGHDSFAQADLDKNRRIDLRFLMAAPDPERLRDMLLK